MPYSMSRHSACAQNSPFRERQHWSHLVPADGASSLPTVPTHEVPARVPADLQKSPGLPSDPLIHHGPPGGSPGAAGRAGGARGATLGSPPEAPGPRQLLGCQSQDLRERETRAASVALGKGDTFQLKANRVSHQLQQLHVFKGELQGAP